jgi:hypothetical protein
MTTSPSGFPDSPAKSASDEKVPFTTQQGVVLAVVIAVQIAVIITIIVVSASGLFA